MKKKLQGTRIAVGMTDGYRYIGIKPPLTEAEGRVMEIELNEYNQITTPGPATTLLMVSGESFSYGSTLRTEHAFKVAQDIATTLRGLRSEPVNVLPEPVGLRGYHSTPFNPYTDM